MTILPTLMSFVQWCNKKMHILCSVSIKRKMNAGGNVLLIYLLEHRQEKKSSTEVISK
jgi:hypothetical protein